MERLFTETDQCNSNKLSLSYTLKTERRHSNKSNRALTKLSLSIMTTFFNDIKFTQDICTQCGPIFFKQSRVKNLLKILQ